MKIEACLTSKNQIWTTPPDIYNYYVKELGFFDPCPLDPKFDGLKISWGKQAFVNPPYKDLILSFNV